jgi:hypothetical protein
MRRIGTLIAFFLCFCAVSLSLESDTYRLLSVAKSGKIILISHPTDKTKYLLDASNAKITCDGKPMEFDELKNYVLIQVKFDPVKSEKEGIQLDGNATEIAVSTPPKAE